jgi:hypothetical protein
MITIFGLNGHFTCLVNSLTKSNHCTGKKVFRLSTNFTRHLMYFTRVVCMACVVQLTGLSHNDFHFWSQCTIQSAHLSNYHISLWRKVFFSFLTNFFPIYINVTHCCEVSPKKIWTRSLIGNMVFGGFPKNISNKTFYFYTKKNIALLLFYTYFWP